MAAAGGGPGGIRRIKRERISPIEGPPRTLIISLELPPLSDTGKTYEASFPNASQIALHPVPPEITINEPRSVSSGRAGGLRSTELGAMVDAGVPAES